VTFFYCISLSESSVFSGRLLQAALVNCKTQATLNHYKGLVGDLRFSNSSIRLTVGCCEALEFF
jgi:hypothetical protein